jgi:galactokinase/mevalonate kinase-like predicted kinase
MAARKVKLTIPARINVLGNPSDGNEGDFATISMAIRLYAWAVVEPADGIALAMANGPDDNVPPACVRFSPQDIPIPYGGECDLLAGAVNRLHAFSAELQEKMAQRGVQIRTWTEVPRQSGLGGSSLFVLLALGGLRAFYELGPAAHNDYVLAELTQRVEEKELGITCGYADRYVPLFGGLAYLDYRGKLHHNPIREEPYVTYERLDRWAHHLRLVAISTGVKRDSGDVHGRMRSQYLKEHAEWESQGGAALPPMLRFMTGAWETAWRGKIALLEGDIVRFGDLMNENHHLVNEMMAYCGFEDAAGWANNLFIDVALANGALGAKLTGAGGGGSVFALMRPGEEARLVAAWEKAAAENGLDSVQIYFPRVSMEGLTVEAG